VTNPGGETIFTSASDEVATRAAPARVLTVSPDERGGWTVDLDVDEPEEQIDAADPSLVRLCLIADDKRSLTVALPLNVWRRIGDRIGEL
jgi:hypothetical protein